jgi:chromosome segregation ATPase
MLPLICILAYNNHMQNEIEMLKQRIAELESQGEVQMERPQAVKEALKEHFEKKPEDLPTEEQVHPQIISTTAQKITDLKKDNDKDEPAHKKMVEELVQFANEHGIVNAAAVVQKVDDPHLIDDFQAALAETFFKIR